MSFDKDNWAIPTGLSRKANKLAKAIAKLAKQRDWNAGQKVFWSPKQWEEKGESYGTDSDLVVLHEGGDHASFFSLDHSYNGGSYDDYEDQLKFLSKHGFYCESLYSWSSAIYEN